MFTATHRNRSEAGTVFQELTEIEVRQEVLQNLTEIEVRQEFFYRN